MNVKELVKGVVTIALGIVLATQIQKRLPA